MKFRRKLKVTCSVGVEISPTVVRAVEIALHGREVVIQHLAEVETPAGAVRNGRVVEPMALSGALRRLWEQERSDAGGGFTTRRCTVAVSAGTLTPHMLTT